MSRSVADSWPAGYVFYFGFFYYYFFLFLGLTIPVTSIMAVRHLVNATLEMIGGDDFRAVFDWQVRYLDIYLFYVYSGSHQEA